MFSQQPGPFVPNQHGSYFREQLPRYISFQGRRMLPLLLDPGPPGTTAWPRGGRLHSQNDLYNGSKIRIGSSNLAQCDGQVTGWTCPAHL